MDGTLLQAKTVFVRQIDENGHRDTSVREIIANPGAHVFHQQLCLRAGQAQQHAVALGQTMGQPRDLSYAINIAHFIRRVLPLERSH